MILYKSTRVLCRFLFAALFRWQVVGAENIPKQGGVILCCNHISNLDPPLLGSGIDRQVLFMAKEELFHVPVLRSFITKLGAFPVKRGGNGRQALRATYKLLEEGKIVGIFPEGTRSKTGELNEAKSGVALFALRSDATVIPVAVIGPYRLFHPVKIVYGKPVDLSALKQQKGNAETLKEATEFIMDRIRQIIQEHTS